MSTDHAAPPRPDWLLGLGMTTVAVAAAVSSFAGLRGLAVTTGWPESLSWLLPLTIDAYAVTASRVWLARSTRSSHARTWAKRNAIGAIATSVAGNATYHAITAGVLATHWLLVVAVSAIPPVVLGLLVHMAHLRTQDESIPADDDRSESQDESSPRTETAGPVRTAPTNPVPELPARRDEGTDDVLMRQVRDLDDRHRAEHGRPISRDALRRELGCSNGRASALLRQARAASDDTENAA